MPRWGFVLVALTACSGDVEFRPAKDAHDLPATKAAYRVKKVEDVDGCRSIGFVRNAESIEELADTTAKNGGTHYRVLEDYGSVTFETDGVSNQWGATGITTHSSTTRAVKHHRYIAEAYLCSR